MYGEEFTEGKAVQEEGEQLLREAMCKHCRVVIAINLSKKKVMHLLKVTRSDWFELFLFHLDSCITVVRGDYSVLNKDKID